MCLCPSFTARVPLGAPRLHRLSLIRPIDFLHLSCPVAIKQVYTQHVGEIKFDTVSKHHRKKGDKSEDIEGILQDKTKPKYDIWQTKEKNILVAHKAEG